MFLRAPTEFKHGSTLVYHKNAGFCCACSIFVPGYSREGFANSARQSKDLARWGDRARYMYVCCGEVKGNDAILFAQELLASVVDFKHRTLSQDPEKIGRPNTLAPPMVFFAACWSTVMVVRSAHGAVNRAR